MRYRDWHVVVNEPEDPHIQGQSHTCCNTEGSQSYGIGRIPITSRDVRRGIKGGMPWSSNLFTEYCLDGKDDIKVFVRAIGYETDKCTSQHSRTNVPRGE